MSPAQAVYTALAKSLQFAWTFLQRVRPNFHWLQVDIYLNAQYQILKNKSSPAHCGGLGILTLHLHHQEMGTGRLSVH